MQRNIVNHCLKLEYQTFQSMNEDLSFYTLGKYSIFYKIGEGAYGKVYKGLDNKTNREVAVKVVDVANVHKLKSQRLKEITLRLIKNQDVLMRVCDNPNLVKCFDVYQNESLKIMMLQYCNGGDLQHHIEKRKKISEKQSLLIFKQILNGIAECHSHMIIHRDLKSENVMIHNGQYKIADFGFSKQLEDDESGRQLQCVLGGITVLGTITNMAPEVMSRIPYGLKADIWSAGIILFQMVFGDFPYKAHDKKVILAQIERSTILQPKRIVFNGYTASIQISDFLRRLLTVDYINRIGWKQLKVHPIFNLIKIDEKVPRYPISNVIFTAPQEEEERFFQDYSNISKLIHQLGEKVMSPSGNVPQPRSNKEIITIKSEETKTFEWMRENLVQCLKVQLIFQEIISKLQGQKMIDFDERASIELVYLLITRCFLTLSPINNKMQQNIEKNKFISQTYGIIGTLYQKIHEMFLRYSKKLTAEQDKLLNKLSDFFKSKEELVNVDKFFNGIENQDFNKEDQLKFIQRNYVDPIKNKLKGPEQVREKVRKLLGNYSNINMIQFKHIQQIDFDSYIQKLL